MAEPTFTADELASLFETTPAPAEPDELEALLGREHVHSVPAPPRQAEADDLLAGLIGDEGRSLQTADGPSSDGAINSVVVAQARGAILPPAEFAWENAYHLVPPPMLRLVKRYPAIGISQHPDHGLVVLAAYLEDKQRRVRRNLQIGNDTFFYAPEIEIVEPDTRAFDCRIVLKTFRHQPGMRIRYWQNTPNGDTPGKTGAFEVTERGLLQIIGPKARR